jgi:rRNA maturation endonuclease Nob1
VLPGSVTIREVKAIKFRCLFCGKEFDTVEACNVCEESH